jgi:Flp pilus assembly protein TadD
VYPVSVKPDGWSGTAALAGVMHGKNFFATTSPQLTGFNEKVTVNARVDPGDPASSYAARSNPAVQEAVNAGAVQKRDTATLRLANPALRVALNPQPLPPKSADTFTASGNALFARGDFAGAAAAFQRAVDADATNAVALHNLAIAHGRLGLTDRATTELRRASDLARAQGDLATARSADGAALMITSH